TIAVSISEFFRQIDAGPQITQQKPKDGKVTENRQYQRRSRPRWRERGGDVARECLQLWRQRAELVQTDADDHLCQPIRNLYKVRFCFRLGIWLGRDGCVLSIRSFPGLDLPS